MEIKEKIQKLCEDANKCGPKGASHAIVVLDFSQVLSTIQLPSSASGATYFGIEPAVEVIFQSIGESGDRDQTIKVRTCQDFSGTKMMTVIYWSKIQETEVSTVCEMNGENIARFLDVHSF